MSGCFWIRKSGKHMKHGERVHQESRVYTLKKKRSVEFLRKFKTFKENSCDYDWVHVVCPHWLTDWLNLLPWFIYYIIFITGGGVTNGLVSGMLEFTKVSPPELSWELLKVKKMHAMELSTVRFWHSIGGGSGTKLLGTPRDFGDQWGSRVPFKAAFTDSKADAWATK